MAGTMVTPSATCLHWEECLFIPKREMARKGKEWRSGVEEDQGVAGQEWAKWSLKNVLVLGWMKGC